jgi:hypothetical protein
LSHGGRGGSACGVFGALNLGEQSGLCARGSRMNFRLCLLLNGLQFAAKCVLMGFGPEGSKLGKVSAGGSFGL